MKWEISYSGRAHKFITANNLELRTKEVIRMFILRYTGQDVSIDVKKLKGKWHGYHRIRIGDIRIILKVDKDSNSIIVDTVDFRNKLY